MDNLNKSNFFRVKNLKFLLRENFRTITTSMALVYMYSKAPAEQQ